MTETCFECGGEVSLVREPYEVRIGRRTVTVVGEFLRCASCGEIEFLPGQMDAMMQEATRTIRADEGLMSSHEVLEFRRSLGLSQADLEILLGVGPKTVGRWERGTVFQSKAADTLMRVLRRHPEVAHELAEEQGIAVPARHQALAEARTFWGAEYITASLAVPELKDAFEVALFTGNLIKPSTPSADRIAAVTGRSAKSPRMVWVSLHKDASGIGSISVDRTTGQLPRRGSRA